MKKKILVILLALTMVFTVGIVLTGCGGGQPTIANARQIQIGMNRNQVRGLVGREDQSVSMFGIRALVWTTPHMTLEVGQVDNSVVSASLITNSGTYSLVLGTNWSRIGSGNPNLQPEGGGNQQPGGNVTMAQMAGRWRLDSYLISGMDMGFDFTEITFNANGTLTAVPRFGSTPITGTFSLANNGRISFNTNMSTINSNFNTWDYRVSMSGNNMTWTCQDFSSTFNLTRLSDSGNQQPGGSVTEAQIVGVWDLLTYSVAGFNSNSSSPFSELDLFHGGTVMGIEMASNNSFSGTFNLAANGRITFNTNSMVLDTFFSQWDYRASIVGGNLLLTWATGDAVFTLVRV